MDAINEAIGTNPREFVIRGVLKPDGSLVLDRVPDLPPGEVNVTIQSRQPFATPNVNAAREWLDLMRQIHREQDARGFEGNPNIERELEELRSAVEYEKKWERIYDEIDRAKAAAADRSC